MPTLYFPTLGGRHFWSDVMVRDCTRVERNHWTGHYRTLNPRDRRLGFGSRTRCFAAARRDSLVGAEGKLRREKANPARRETLVVLLHGLYRSRRAMGHLEQALRARGLSTDAINYPSAVWSIQDHADQVNELLDETEGFTRVIFVSHSLGGFVARAALGIAAPWRSRMSVGGLVQLGPPNQGAQLARILREKPIIGALLSETPRALGDPSETPEPPAEIPVLAIAGGTAGGKGFNRLLDGNNDGVVRVVETRLRGPHVFHLIPTFHTLLMNHPETVRRVAEAVQTWSGQPIAGAEG